jgi:hypothetical protein
MAIEQKVPAVESADVREQREHADRADNEPRGGDRHAEHSWTLVNGITRGVQKRG